MFSEEYISIFPWLVVVAGSGVAASTDLRSRRIPNWLTGPLLMTGLIWSAFAGGLPGLGSSLGGMAIAGIPFIILWLLAGSGAGDAKMMLAVGAWLGSQDALIALAAVALAGGILCLGASLVRRHLIGSLSNILALSVAWMFLLRGKATREMVPQLVSTRVPYGVAICAGVCAAAVWGMQ